MDDYIYSVSEISAVIKQILISAPPLQDVWIKGEVSRFNYSSQGHLYFNLKDESCIMPCVMWKDQVQLLKFKLEDGIKIVVNGNVSSYERQGIYQIRVAEIIQEGKGDLFIAFEKLKKKLSEEGLFDEKHKKPIPKFVKTVGLVTSEDGAAVRDMIKILRSGYPSINIILRPCLVQGDSASNDISNAIAELNDYGNVDVIIVGRGGGSIEDLWAFNEEKTARAIYASKIPVISAVGHEIDYTIADFVADRRAATPTEAGTIIVNNYKELVQSIENSIETIEETIDSRFRVCRDSLTKISRSVAFRKPYERINNLSQQVDDIMGLINRNFRELPGKWSLLVEKSRQSLLRYNPEEKIKNYGQTLSSVGKNLEKNALNYLKAKQDSSKSLLEKLQALSPYAVLNRGYSMTMKKGKLLKSTKDLTAGDDIETRFSDGIVASRVTDKSQ